MERPSFSEIDQGQPSVRERIAAMKRFLPRIAIGVFCLGAFAYPIPDTDSWVGVARNVGVSALLTNQILDIAFFDGIRDKNLKGFIDIGTLALGGYIGYKTGGLALGLEGVAFLGLTIKSVILHFQQPEA